MPAPEPGPEDELLTRELGATIERAFRELAPLDRHIVRAALVDGTAPGELAAALGMRRDAVYKRLQRARKRLTAALREHR